METLHFQVANLYFTLHTPQAEELKELLPSYAPFHVKKLDEPAIFTATIDDDLVDTAPEGQEVGQFDCGGTNHAVYLTTEGYKFVISDWEKRPVCAMRTSADMATVRITTMGAEHARRYGLNNALMIAFSFSSAYHKTILMHASVTLWQGKGHLFLGVSGTGKSTHSSLWIKHLEGAELLNDDNPAVRCADDGSIEVYGTPWSGKTPCYRNMKAPVAAFVDLEQHPQNIIQREQTLKAFSDILVSCSVMSWDKPSYRCILDTVTAIVSRMPVYHLQCRPDEEAALLCQRTIYGA